MFPVSKFHNILNNQKQIRSTLETRKQHTRCIISNDTLINYQAKVYSTQKSADSPYSAIRRKPLPPCRREMYTYNTISVPTDISNKNHNIILNLMHHMLWYKIERRSSLIIDISI